MADYNVIILGYPNWWETMPIAVFTFLEEYDFSGKTIIPFWTHEGSGMGRSEWDIKKLCSKAKVLAGLAIIGGIVNRADKKILTWLKKLDLTDDVLPLYKLDFFKNRFRITLTRAP